MSFDLYICNACNFFYFFIKCMQSMTMTLFKCCAYVRLHISWSKSLLYIFSLINHIDSFATYVNQLENRKINRFTASHKRVDAQKLSRVFIMYVYVMYMSCNACIKTLLLFCVYKQRLCHVFAMYVIAMHVNRSDNAKNRLIYCIMQACKCTKAESCLCNNCVNVVY